MNVFSISLSLAGLAVAATVHAAPEVEIGGEYNLNITHTNDGLNEPNDTEQNSFNVQAAKLSLRGKLSDQITWNVLYKVKESELERYWFTNKIADNLDLSIGKQKVKIYGLHRKLASSISPITGSYLSNNPMKDKMAIELSYKLAGAISLQAMEDYSKCSDTTTYVVDPTTNTATTAGAKTASSCTSWNEGTSSTAKQKQPALAFEWYGNFGEFSPLVQYAVYDLGKSNSASVGLRYKTEILDSYVDYTVDTRNARGGTAGAYKEEESTYTGMVVYAELKAGQFSPFLHVSTLGTDPYLAEGASDSAKVKAESNSAGSLGKNEMTYALGTYFDRWGSFYRPYAHVAILSGDYVDPAESTKKKDLSRTDIVAGVMGKF